MVRFNIIDNKTFYIKYSIISVIAIFLFAKCTYQKLNDNDIKIKKFPFEIDIVPIQESKDDIFNYAYVDIKIINDYVVVVDRKSDIILRFLDKNSLSYLFSKISKGRGPNEILLPGAMQVKGDTLILIDKIKKQFLIYDINKIHEDKLLKPVNSHEINMTAINDIKMINQNRFIISGDISDGLVCLYDSMGSKTGVVGEPPAGYPTGYANIGYFNSSHKFRIETFPHKNCFLVSSMFSDKLQIFCNNGSDNFQITGPDNIVPKFNFKSNYIVIDDESKLGYLDVVIKNKYIYALYLGYSQTEMMNSAHITTSIYVFKHNGKPVGQYNLGRNIKCFDVDEKNGYFYTLQLNPNKIFKYKYEME